MILGFGGYGYGVAVRTKALYEEQERCSSFKWRIHYLGSVVDVGDELVRRGERCVSCDDVVGHIGLWLLRIRRGRFELRLRGNALETSPSLRRIREVERCEVHWAKRHG